MEGMKSYGYGIVGKNGLDSAVKFRSEEKEKAAAEFVEWKDQQYPDNAPHRLVELFYKEQS